MSTDSDSAFADPASPGWTKGLPPGRRFSNQAGRATLSTLETTGNAAGSQMDRLPFGLSLSSASQAQSIPLTRNRAPLHRLRTAPSVDAAFTRVSNQARQLLADQVSPLRLANHLSVVAVAAIILILSQVDIPTWEVSLRLLPSSALSATGTGSLGSRVSAYTSGPSMASLGSQDSLQRSAIPFTIVHHEPQKEIQYYTVQPGDTVLGIAKRFGLQPETVQWSNPNLERNADLIRPGDQLKILPIDGAVHVVAPGDTLSSLVTKYKVSLEDIINYPANGLENSSSALRVGQELVIPGGTRTFVQPQVYAYSGSAPATAKIGSGSFVWPASGSISQGYWSGHPAIDIAGWTGAPVKAADSGYVALAASGGWNSGYGNHVVIDHGNGFVTLYAHLNSIYVRGGESVSRGQQIGSLGSTGRSTGPHLHLEIRYQGVPRNPIGYLP
jgi:LysM repeat protein